MLWNVFPFHPHDADDPMSNRCHSRAEREETWPLLQALVSMVQPKRIVAIGRDAHLALAGLETEVTAIRHPSYGGQREFINGMYGLYGVADDPVGSPELPLGPRYAETAKALA
jgi:uracil-DNA glycosylase